ncbi:DUF1007 family protein [Sneathiella sp.]|uniref:DUF1007 family protein n=1 Tax=Sneathiella sp. TaxID=1964365 RepID=UPI00260D54B2|nr:DUF1007 family protein [Sneathiella sp.]MDF2366625.1 DUF1007 family protein [Sneathiella sp.]
MIFICCIFLLAPQRAVLAHPHVWTDMTIKILFDDNGRAYGLHQTWLFDDYYTAYAVEGTDRDGNGTPDQEELDEIMKVNMGHLKEYGYFTEVAVKNKVIKLKPVTNMSTKMVDKRLEMSFVTPFEEPASVTGNDFSYAIFDPTYYVEMLHAETDTPVIISGAPEGCTYKLIPPNPDPSAVAQAAMLDASERGATGLGSFFAERVNLICPEE